MIDFSSLTPAEFLVGEDQEETILFESMYNDAKRFMSSFAWCEGFRQSFFGCGVGGICAVFLFEIIPKSKDVDDWLWVIVGDLPSAYLVTDQATDASGALAVYIEEMRDWVSAAEAGQSVEDLIPVNVSPSQENARNLKTRLDSLVDLRICGEQ